jgi:hypothetical protein
MQIPPMKSEPDLEQNENHADVAHLKEMIKEVKRLWTVIMKIQW